MNDSQPKNQTVSLVTAVPGPKSQALRAREEAHLAPGLQGFAIMAGIVVDTAAGSAVTCVDGNTFLDFIGGIGVNGLGHSHPRYVAALQAQVAKASVGSFTSEPRVELLERVASHAPKGRDGKPVHLAHEHLDSLARADGFSNGEEMAAWFADQYGLPFRGYLHQWVPLNT